MKKLFSKKFGVSLMLMLAITAMAAVSASAAAPDGLDTATVTTAVSGAVTDTIALMSGLLPYALTVFAAIWGVKKAMRFFKGAAN